MSVEEVRSLGEPRNELWRAETGRPPRGAAAILREDPQFRPGWLKRTPAPLCHTRSAERWVAFKRFYRSVCDAFAAAAARMRGERRRGRSEDFPPGTFPPSLPFARPPERELLPLRLDPLDFHATRRVPGHLRVEFP